ncbi:MBOAT family protein [Melioribacteraceae bacterium 4301-Me]|uniref:MBOAT family O-acyltransferase n=1 Tax=Pyranulibacter aquaticus TaxID=3163344 RepID=UPI00359C0A39
MMLINLSLDKILDLLKYNQNDPLIFSTILFLFFFFIVLIFYNLFSKNKNIRVFLLIIFSLYFYYKVVGFYFIILIVSAVINFYLTKWMSTYENFTKRRWVLILIIVLNLAILAYFKYTNFILQIINDVANKNIEPLAIFLPIGISFYTFKALNYVFDVYLDTLKPAKNLSDFCVFLFFFPNLLAGPIDRASEFLPQIDKEPFISKEDLGKAIFLISAGLLKKVVIADYISLNYVDRIFDFPIRYTGLENLIAVYGYALQIYCDFSGYSDMAIGIAILLGFKLMDNFNSPFKATSIADFWRRWHISLSKWLLDYLFRPIQFKFRNLHLYGNMIALFITFLLCGLWHGAGWNFILWGALHGFFMSFALLIQKPKNAFYTKLRIKNTRFLKFFQVIITFHLVAFSFLVFRANNISLVGQVISQIFTFFHGEIITQFIEKLPLIFTLILVGYLFHFIPLSLENKIKKLIAVTPWFGKALILAVVIWIAAQFKSADIQPFIYFQF